MTLKETDRLLYIADLISGRQAGTLNPQEQAELDARLLADPMLKLYFDALNDKEKVRADLELMNSFDPELTLANFHKLHTAPKAFKLWPRIVVAAAITIAIFGAGLFYFYNQHSKQNSTTFYSGDVTPGKNGATLTLANGKKIRLTDAANGPLAEEAGLTITKSKDGQIIYNVIAGQAEPGKINTLSTANGETYRVHLSDGSLVWLNAASSLTYALTINDGGMRKVKLQGEAYFEIAKDKLHPFIVESEGQQVRVLGTHFNISAYANEPKVKTTLLEGSINIKMSGDMDPTEENILRPNQQAILSNGAIRIQEVEAEDAIAWQQGYFVFNNETLEEIMRRVERWYDVRIVYDDPSLKTQTFIGTISKYERVSKILNTLARTNTVVFNVENKVIRVSKKE